MEINTTEFIKKSRKIHNDKFNYDKFTYKGSKVKSILICNDCNSEFSTTPSNNLLGNGCKNCDNLKKGKEYASKKLTEKFPEYKFNLTNYKNRDSLIKFICDENHQNESKFKSIFKNGCSECKLNQEILNIEKIFNIKINKFSISKIDFTCNKCKFEFSTSKRNLKKYKCKVCKLYEKSELLKTKKVLLLKYGKKLTLQCQNNHTYEQTYQNLISGKNCKKCYLDDKKVSLPEIKERIENIHGNKFKYLNLNDAKNLHTKIKIVCDNKHSFTQKLSNHLQGKGCPICKESFGERKITKILKENNIKFIKQYKFDKCLYKNKLPFDFFIPDMNLCIEYDGQQHFEPIDFFGGKEEFNKTKIKDNIKNNFCKENKIKLLRISFKDDVEEKLISHLNVNKLVIL